MPTDTGVDLVTGAFSYSGAEIAQRLLDRGRAVRTLTFHPERPHPLRERVVAEGYRFDDPQALARSLEGITTLYNTYWVRFDHGASTLNQAVANSRALFEAARLAGVSHVVHVSITHPAADSPLPYFRGKALVERALAETGLAYSIVRPTWVFGGDRDVLLNNIAWILRRSPVFALPGDGRYQVQPVHIVDLGRICIEAAEVAGDTVLDAAGPERMAFDQLVALVRRAVGSRAAVVRVPPVVMELSARALGLVVGDVVLTRDEIVGLTAGLLISDQPARGTVVFSQWLSAHGDSLGRSYANELKRHFAA
jgi:uncharacterized protein YbjT (DUF2867 family)